MSSFSGLDDDTTPATAPPYRAGPPLPPAAAWQLRVTISPGPAETPSTASPTHRYIFVPGYPRPAG
ncbi:hypothetical protein ACFQQB_38985 [Nonomuraea rubra]|uniref:hypothetical protein n=1 Tax=Nonomuraea rubra TaxID=46180 RepID=UPI0036177D81